MTSMPTMTASSACCPVSGRLSAKANTVGTIADSVAGIWHASSTNGTSWTINYSQLRDLPWDNTAAGEHLYTSLGFRAVSEAAWYRKPGQGR